MSSSASAPSTSASPAGATEAIESASDYLNRGARTSRRNVVARWLPLSVEAALPTDPNVETVTAALPIGLAPGGSADAVLGLTVPTVPGDYLLFLDIVTPEHGSLVASGADPTLVRVTVLPAPYRRLDLRARPPVGRSMAAASA